MTLREQLCEPFDGLPTETVSKLEAIVDKFAVEFAEFYFTKKIFETKETYWTPKQLLEIYKETL